MHLCRGAKFLFQAIFQSFRESWRSKWCEDVRIKVSDHFLGLALLEGSMFLPGKHGCEDSCGKWPDAGAETALSWTQYAASATGRASHVVILLFKRAKLEI